MRNIKHPKFPCRICTKNVHDKDKAVQCDLCELWIHIKCNSLNYLDYRYLQNCDKSWYCIECCSTIFPFNSLSSNKKFLACCTSTDNNIIQWKDLENDHASSLSLKPLSFNGYHYHLKLLVNQFNNTTPENSNDPEKISSSKYYDIEEIITLKYLTTISHYPYSIQMHVLQLQLRLLQVVPFLTLLIIYHINVAMT